MPLLEVEEKITALIETIGDSDISNPVDDASEKGGDEDNENSQSTVEDELEIEILGNMRQEGSVSLDESKIGRREGSYDSNDSNNRKDYQQSHKIPKGLTKEDLRKEHEEAADDFLEAIEEEIYEYREAVLSFRRMVGNYFGMTVMEHKRRKSLLASEISEEERTDARSISIADSVVGNATAEECRKILEKNPNSYEAHYKLAFFELN